MEGPTDSPRDVPIDRRATAALSRDAASETLAAPPAAPQRVGPYRVLAPLGSGASGTVLLAEDTRVGRKVALKLLAPALALSETVRARFRREALAASRLDHPGLCTVYEADVDGPSPYIAMRVVEGRTLEQRLAEARAIARGSSEGRAARCVLGGGADPCRCRGMCACAFVEKVARAAHAAHEAGLVHRDLKPANVMVADDGEPVVLDFGLVLDTGDEARLTDTGALVGSPAYMAPEQILGDRSRVDRRTDVYALGVVLYELVTGRLPFESPTREGLFREILTREPSDVRRSDAALSRDLGVIVATALEKAPDRRYQSALDLAEDLRRLRERRPIRARPVGHGERLRRWTQRNPALAASLAALFVCMAAALAVTLHLLGVARSEAHAKGAALERGDAALERARLQGLLAAANGARERDPVLALQLVREAARISRGPEVMRVLREALALSRERARLVGHGMAVHNVALAPDGRRVLTCSSDATARLWDATGRQVAVLRGHGALIPTISFSPQGDRVLTAGEDGTARVWDIEGRELFTVSTEGRFHAARFSPDGARFVVASDDGTAAVWTREGKQVLVLRGDGGQAVDAMFSPDGTSVLTGFSDGTTRLWDGAGREVARFVGGTGQVLHIAFSPGGDLVAANTKDGSIRVWRVSGGPPLAVLPGAIWRQPSLAFAPTGDRIVTLCPSDQVARVWTLDGTELAVLRHPAAPVAVAWTPDGRSIVTTAGDGRVRVWDARGRLTDVLAGHTAAVVAAVVSRDGTTLATASEDRTARLWDLAPNEPARLAGDVVRRVRFVAGGERLLGVSDGRARTWDLAGRELADYEIPGGGPGFAWASEDGASVLTWGDGGAALWTADGARVADFARGTRVVYAALSRDGSRVLTRSPEAAEVWDRGGPLLHRCAGHEAAVASACFHPHDARLLTASADGTARVWGADGAEVARLECSSPLRSASWAPDGGAILTCSRDGSVRVWGGPGDGTRAVLRHTPYMRFAEFSPSGDRVVACDGAVHLWDLAGRELGVLRGGLAGQDADPLVPAGSAALKEAVAVPDAPVCSFSRDGRLVVVNSKSGAAVWDEAGRARAILGAGEPTIAVAMAPNGSRVATVTAAGAARLWSASGEELDALPAEATRIVGAEFSPDGARIVTTPESGPALVWRVRAEELLALTGERSVADLTRDQRAQYRDLLAADNDVWLAAYEVVDRAIERHVLVDDACAAVVADASLDAPVRDAAMRLLSRRWDDLTQLANDAWGVVRLPHRNADDYRRAHDVVAAVARRTGEPSTTLGVAQYRVGRYEDALATLGACEEGRARDGKGPNGVGLAYLALSLHALGRSDEARATLARVRELHAAATFRQRITLDNALRDAESVIAPRKAADGAPPR